MSRIILARSRLSADQLGVDPNTSFCVVAKGYFAPIGIPVVDLNVLIADPTRLNNGGTFVIVGLSKLLTPAKRVKLGQVLLRPRDGLRKISVDSVLFVSEPWRIFWHFFATETRYYGDYPNSYLAETRFNAAHELQQDDPFSLTTVVTFGTGKIRSIDPYVFGPVVEDVIETTSEIKEKYAHLKEKLFDDLSSIAAIKRGLSDFAHGVCARRRIPLIARLFDKPAGDKVRITRTDLGIDNYLGNRIRHVVDLTNGIARSFQ